MDLLNQSRKITQPVVIAQPKHQNTKSNDEIMQLMEDGDQKSDDEDEDNVKGDD